MLETERENGIKKTFFRDYTQPSLLSSSPLQAPGGQMEVARDEVTGRWKEGGMEDDAVTDVHTSRELASDGLGTAVSLSWIKAASQASICPPVCLSVYI